MANPTIKIVNAETGEEIEREMNAQEFAQWKNDQADEAAKIADKEATLKAKNDLLARLGITEQEAILLLA